MSAPSALADQAITIKATGLAPGQPVAITARAADERGGTWRAEASFAASPAGVVDLATAVPAGGSYQGADGMGLLWSMGAVPPTSGNQYFTATPPQDQPGFQVRLTVTSGSRLLATRVVTREWMAPGETARVLTLKADKVSGVLFLPPPGTPRHPGVLAFGGAEGGMSQVYTAALLAAHGYPALSVAYFDSPGLPAQLASIPLEYFAAAGQILARQPATDPAHVLALGYSRGSEAALLLAGDFPRLFHGAIVYSPSSDVNWAQNDDTQPAWTLDGKGILPAPIMMSHLSGPVLAFAGADDALWGSGPSADQISSQLALAGSRYPNQVEIYPDAGHGVGTFPYAPIGSQALGVLGGTRAGDLVAQRSGWSRVLALLARLG